MEGEERETLAILRSAHLPRFELPQGGSKEQNMARGLREGWCWRVNGRPRLRGHVWSRVTGFVYPYTRPLLVLYIHGLFRPYTRSPLLTLRASCVCVCVCVSVCLSVCLATGCLSCRLAGHPRRVRCEYVYVYLYVHV